MARQLLYRNSEIKIHIDGSMIIVSWMIEKRWVVKKILKNDPETAIELVEFVRNHYSSC